MPALWPRELTLGCDANRRASMCLSEGVYLAVRSPQTGTTQTPIQQCRRPAERCSVTRMDSRQTRARREESRCYAVSGGHQRQESMCCVIPRCTEQKQARPVPGRGLGVGAEERLPLQGVLAGPGNLQRLGLRGGHLGVNTVKTHWAPC